METKAKAGRMLKPSEVQTRMRCSRATLARLLHEGRIPRVVLSAPGSQRRQFRIPEAALERYLLGLAVPPERREP
jgi:excisionase family DNA binding protein